MDSARDGTRWAFPMTRRPRPGNFEGGVWFFTVNGQVFPQIPAPAAPGELWRFLNARASRSYDLVLQDDQTGKAIPFQVISLDGVALDSSRRLDCGRERSGHGEETHPVPCPVQSLHSLHRLHRRSRFAPLTWFCSRVRALKSGCFRRAGRQP